VAHFLPHVAQEEARLVHKIVLDLTVDIHGKGHVISMDNYFTSVGFLYELAFKQIYTTDTVRINRIELLLTLKNVATFRNAPQGTLE
jgi:hypothetical protein